MPQKMTEQQIADYIAAVECSGALGKSQRRLRLLKHLIVLENAGQGEQLKAYAIGLDVFEKPTTFDPAVDSSVRVEMGRLRTGIAVFEGSPFATTDLRVEIAVGTYRPTLTPRAVPEQAQPLSDLHPLFVRKTHPLGRLVLGICLCVVALVLVVNRYFGSDPSDMRSDPAAITIIMGAFEGDAEIALRAKTIMTQSLLRTQSFSLLDAMPAGEAAQTGGVIYVLNGFAQPVGTGGHRLDIDLVDLQSAQIIWSKSAVLPGGADVVQVTEDQFASELRVRLFGVTKDILQRRDVETLGPQELFVMATWVPGPAENAVVWEQERITLMRRALDQEPEFGAAHSVLADKLRYLANVYAPANTTQAGDDAIYHIQRAIELVPMDADAMFNVAQAQWHGGAINDSLATLDRVLELDRGHQLARFLRLVTPFTCTVPTDEVLRQAIAFDTQLAPDNPIRWITLTWISWLLSNQQSYAEALVYEEAAALIFEVPYSFMRRAMILNALSRPDEAAAVLARQSVNWPDVNPSYFASTTYRRLCAESQKSARFIAPYAALAEAMRILAGEPN